jgi:hypothetical protein
VAPQVEAHVAEDIVVAQVALNGRNLLGQARPRARAPELREDFTDRAADVRYCSAARRAEIVAHPDDAAIEVADDDQ